MRLLAGTLLLASLAVQAAAAPPNIVVVLLDDLGYSDYGWMGAEIRTPSIDALAAGGTSLTQFYVTPRCSPTRAALMTGEDPHTAGLGFLPLPPGVQSPSKAYQGFLDPSLLTLPQALRNQGYATYMSGKWHLGEAPEHWPRRYGFDRYFGLISGASSYYELLEGGPFERRMAEDDALWTPPERGFYMTEAFTQRALAYLEAHEIQTPEQPFFLYLSYTAPHWPLHAPLGEIQRYQRTYEIGPTAIANRRAAIDQSRAQALPHADAQLMATYAAQVSLADAGIGRVMALLKEQGQLDNTLILVFSDNGASAEEVRSRGLHQAGATVGARGSYLAYGPTWASVSNRPLRGHKGTTYEGGVRTPLIGRWPAGGITGGRIDRQSIASVRDVMPALLAAAAGKQQPLLSTLRGEPADRGAPVFLAHAGWGAVRDGRWKAVRAPGQNEWQLFDLQLDPQEVHPVDDVERLATLRRSWRDWSHSVGADPDFDPRAFYRELMQR